MLCFSALCEPNEKKFGTLLNWPKVISPHIFLPNLSESWETQHLKRKKYQLIFKGRTLVRRDVQQTLERHQVDRNNTSRQLRVLSEFGEWWSWQFLLLNSDSETVKDKSTGRQENVHEVWTKMQNKTETWRAKIYLVLPVVGEGVGALAAQGTLLCHDDRLLLGPLQ